jgi:6-phosphogluconolactonase
MTDRPGLEVFATGEGAAEAAANAIVTALEAALTDRGAASLAVTGGSSPGPIYDRLSASDLDWSHIAITLSDERWVNRDSPDSNERLVRERLLIDKAATARFTPLKSQDTAEHGAWTADLRVAALVPFDVLLLGMGEDGHIASLFPGNPVLEQGLDPAAARLVLHAPAGKPAPAQDRVSLTLAAMASARLILILTSGEAKRAVLEGEGDEPVHRLIQAARGEVRLLWSA